MSQGSRGLVELVLRCRGRNGVRGSSEINKIEGSESILTVKREGSQPSEIDKGSQ